MNWSQESGLSVGLDILMSVKQELDMGGSFRNERYTAQVADFSVSVNQEAVNNAEQTYPLLVFQELPISR
ncbi:hypothetical protein [Paenibacillus agricola]|uniref:Uncharacterized protein n=1 Tax=Paenibacillus agricola TaxID=2716264 RepID=A0ABX0JFS5_9BACL|nr:hypothetical protein [Paenibacillus agricola]NHN34763.1 hypothetical protein [Paenibacillus agricola]